ncbi:MAG: bifunctional 4-hydroxy-2-oxoglutarate aldolase/2-dehydro-3-deoxy-phosphogluconate aldolase [Bacteroidetes bacterium]|nr:bifunctional 4-hydroxy-2-oxoglutarate aldolase/2-dehydro-3-deoxy-phosphogluconate aldolase [Bacteroidota bacterium]
MAYYSKYTVLNQLFTDRLVPLFYHSDVEVSKKIIAACYHGGSRLLEFTNRGDFAVEQFSELSKYVLNELPGMILGVGSLTDAASASAYIMRGANFIVTPTLKKDIAKVCNRRKIPWMAGCGSLTEINKAEEYGADIIKLFPGTTLGPSFVKAILGPQPWSCLMPTGGVSTDKENLNLWFESGVVCVGLGSKLIVDQWVRDKDFQKITEAVQKTLATIKEIHPQ